MLAKKEKALMKVIYEEAMKTDGKCVMKPVDVLKGIPYKFEFSSEELEPSLRALALDGYFEFVDTDKKGETLYYFDLQQKGYAFPRELEKERRSAKWKISLSLTTASIGFLIFIIKFIIDRFA